MTAAHSTTDTGLVLQQLINRLNLITTATRRRRRRRERTGLHYGGIILPLHSSTFSWVRSVFITI